MNAWGKNSACCHVANYSLSRLELIWLIFALKISKMSKKNAFLGISSGSQYSLPVFQSDGPGIYDFEQHVFLFVIVDSHISCCCYLQLIILIHSLWASSPLSHALKQQRLKRSCGKESGEEAPRKWACLDFCNFFISASPERVKHHWSKSGKGEKNFNLLLFDEEQLNPMEWIINHTFTQRKISHPHLQSEEKLSDSITDVLLNFQSISS